MFEPLASTAVSEDVVIEQKSTRRLPGYGNRIKEALKDVKSALLMLRTTIWDRDFKYAGTPEEALIPEKAMTYLAQKRFITLQDLLGDKELRRRWPMIDFRDIAQEIFSALEKYDVRYRADLKKRKMDNLVAKYAETEAKR
jgi:hypothetical protein